MSQDDVEISLQPVRVLLARLLEMQDERRSLEAALRLRASEMDRLGREIQEADGKRDELMRLERQLRETETEPVEHREIRDGMLKIVAQRNSLVRSLNRLSEEGEKLKTQIDPLNALEPRLEKLIRWTKDHFPGLNLTIDDAQ